MDTTSFPPPTEPMVAAGEPIVVDRRAERRPIGAAVLTALVVLAVYILAVGNQKVADWLTRRQWAGSAQTARSIMLFPQWRVSPVSNGTGFWIAQIVRDVVLVGLTLLLAWVVMRRLRPFTFVTTWLVGAMATLAASVIAAMAGQLTIRLAQQDADLLAKPVGELSYLLQANGTGATFGLLMGIIVGFAMALVAYFRRREAPAVIAEPTKTEPVNSEPVDVVSP